MRRRLIHMNTLEFGARPAFGARDSTCEEAYGHPDTVWAPFRIRWELVQVPADSGKRVIQVEAEAGDGSRNTTTRNEPIDPLLDAFYGNLTGSILEPTARYFANALR